MLQEEETTRVVNYHPESSTKQALHEALEKQRW
jgi:hypothetical protein